MPCDGGSPLHLLPVETPGGPRFGLEVLRPRERRQPRMPNAISQLVVQRIVAFALGQPGLGPDRISAELRRKKWGGIKVSPAGIWRVLRRHGLNTRRKRLSLVAGYAVPPEPEKREPEPERHIEADHPGELVQMDCMYIGRLSGAKGAVWQYTAIDVASAFTWAELHTTPREPLCALDVTARTAGGQRPLQQGLGARTGDE